MADAPHKRETVTLTVAGEKHEGWTSIVIERSLDTLCGSFTLGLTERWPERPQRFTLEAGAACSVAIGGETVITGYIDRLAPSIEGRTHAIEIAGRDKAGDLVDCSAVHSPGHWRNQTVAAIIEALIAPFGIKLTVTADQGPPLKVFALQPGETVGAVIERLCRMRGLLCFSRADGAIELATPAAGSAGLGIVEGENLLAGSAEHDVTERFSEYTLRGQAAGDDAARGRTVAQPGGKATDPAVKRYRPLIVIAEEQATIGNLETRARWEASTRAARAQPGSVTLNGWRDAQGKLLAPNSPAQIKAPSLFMDGAMLIEAVKLSLDERGELAELRLVPPGAWQQLPVPEAAQASRVGGRR